MVGRGTIMIFRNMKTEFRKILSSYGFYLCIFFTSILCFATYIYEDGMNGNKYSVVRSLMSFDREYMLEDTIFCSFDIIRKGAGNWLILFIPIIAAFPFVPQICDEYESKSIRFEIFRMNRFSFYISKFLTGCLCGGFAVMLGFVIFVIAIHILFPFIDSYSPELQLEYIEMLASNNIHISNGKYYIEVLKRIGEMFLYGMLWTAPAMALMGVIRNKYLVMCTPFFLKYALNQTCEKVRWSAIENSDAVNSDFLHVNNIINPDALADLSSYGNDIWKVLLFNAVFLMFLFIVYLIMLYRRTDCGE